MSLLDLEKTATTARRNTLAAIYYAGSGHPGGSLSVVDLLVYLYQRELRWDPARLDDPERDRLILSKGHCCPALYAVAAECGILAHSDLAGLRKLGSPLQGHTHVRDLPWTETSTGSLGQGFSVAIGMALGLRHQGKPARVYAILGDGELQEGEVWEGAMSAGHFRLDNLCAIVDYNKMQSDDLNANIMGLEPLAKKWEAFNWHVVEIDGHDFSAIAGAFEGARRVRGKPTVILAHTSKGRGVSFMDGSPLWHGSCKIRDEELQRALSDLGTEPAEIERYLDGSIWKGGR